MIQFLEASGFRGFIPGTQKKVKLVLSELVPQCHICFKKEGRVSEYTIYALVVQ